MIPQKIVILYATVDGQSLKICQRIAGILKQQKCDYDLFNINNFKGDLNKYTTVLIGASIRYGKHQETVFRFIQSHLKELNSMKSAFFSVNLVARNLEKNTAETNPYVIKFMEKISWKPDLVSVFAGVLDYESYSFWDRIMIKLIMKITKGPTKTSGPLEYTNWQAVEQFALEVSCL